MNLKAKERGKEERKHRKEKKPGCRSTKTNGRERPMIYQCKRFENWKQEVLPFVQEDGRILNAGKTSPGSKEIMLHFHWFGMPVLFRKIYWRRIQINTKQIQIPFVPRWRNYPHFSCRTDCTKHTWYEKIATVIFLSFIFLFVPEQNCSGSG